MVCCDFAVICISSNRKHLASVQVGRLLERTPSRRPPSASTPHPVSSDHLHRGQNAVELPWESATQSLPHDLPRSRLARRRLNPQSHYQRVGRRGIVTLPHWVGNILHQRLGAERCAIYAALNEHSPSQHGNLEAICSHLKALDKRPRVFQLSPLLIPHWIF